MRKLLSLAAFLAVTSVACADLLYWQVGNADNTLTDDMAGYSYATIYASKDGGGTRTTLESVYGPGDTAPVNSVYNQEMKDAEGFYAKLSSVGGGDYAGYSFAIELFDASGNVLGHAGWTSADSLSSAIVSKTDFNANWSTMASGLGAGGWSAGAAATPEPTSALLMLLGAAMLGLRRKKMA